MANGDGRNENKNKYTANENAKNFNEFNKLIDSFCSHSDDLRSAGWDEFRKIIEEYKTPILDISECSSTLSNIISDLQQKVDSTLAEYSGNLSFPGAFESDPQKAIATVGKEIIECKRNISSLEHRLYKEITIYDPILGAIKGKQLDEKVKIELEKANEYLEDLKTFKDLVESLFSIKKEFLTKFTELLEKINSVKFC